MTLIIMVFGICVAIFIIINNKEQGISQNDIYYNEVYSNKYETNYTKNTNADNEMNLSKKDKEVVSKVDNIKIKVNDNILKVKLENNPLVDSLLEKLKQGDITINAHEYGNFEKVGNLGFNLPTNDIQTNTTEGDVMLYQGNQITIFYGSNSWRYTRIGYYS